MGSISLFFIVIIDFYKLIYFSKLKIVLYTQDCLCTFHTSASLIDLSVGQIILPSLKLHTCTYMDNHEHILSFSDTERKKQVAKSKERMTFLSICKHR